jgi:hypothetical protein
MKFQKFGYKVELKTISEDFFKVTLDGEDFCKVTEMDGEWEAYNSMTDRTGATPKDAVIALMEVTV